MSYVVHFWSQPFPKSLEDANRIFAELQAQPRPQNPLFQMLAKRLTARFPCITEMDEDDPALAWSDGPLDGITDGATYGIGILSQRVDEVQPFVVETATTLGLVVYDEQQGEVYLPGGTTLTSEGPTVGRHLGMEIGGRLGMPLVERTLADALGPLLLRAGFEEIKALGSWWRTVEHSAQSLRLMPMDNTAELVSFDVEVTVTDKRIKPMVEGILKAAGQRGEKPAATAVSSLALFSLFFRMPSNLAKLQHPLRFEIRSIEELHTLAVELRGMVADQVLPVLDVCVNAGNLTAFVLSNDRQYQRIIGSSHEVKDGFIKSRQVTRNLFGTEGCGGLVTGLILAAATGSSQLQEVADLLYRQLEYLPKARFAAEKAKLDACMAELRDQKMIE